MIKYFCTCGHRIIPIETVWLHYDKNKITKSCQRCKCNSPELGSKIKEQYLVVIDSEFKVKK